MRMRRYVVFAIAPLLALASFGGTLFPQDDAQRPPLPEKASQQAGIQTPFPDFGHLPSKDQYEGPLFQMSQAFPKKQPGADKVPDFLKIPFNENDGVHQNWLKYMLGVRSYCFEGNVEVDFDVYKNTQKNTNRQWYHAPWQHWGRNGREGIRGLTREATAQCGQLADTQTGDFQTYAVGGSSGFPVGKIIGVTTYGERFGMKNYRVSSTWGGYKSSPPQ